MDSSNEPKGTTKKLQNAINYLRKETAEFKNALTDPNAIHDLLNNPENNFEEKVKTLESELKKILSPLRTRTHKSTNARPFERMRTKQPQTKSPLVTFLRILGERMTLGSCLVILMNLALYTFLTSANKSFKGLGFRSEVDFSVGKFGFITLIMFLGVAVSIFCLEVFPPLWEWTFDWISFGVMPILSIFYFLITTKVCYTHSVFRIDESILPEKVYFVYWKGFFFYTQAKVKVLLGFWTTCVQNPLN